MGGYFSKIIDKLWGEKEARILILGLDGAGKTTILYLLHLGEVVQTIPTIGFNIETVKHNKTNLQVWDLGGQESIRPYWRCYYADTKATLYEVDSHDRDRITHSATELKMMLGEEELKGAVLLVLANKHDMPDPMTVAEITQYLDLTSIKDRTWQIFKTVATDPKGGVKEAIEWLAVELEKK